MPKKTAQPTKAEVAEVRGEEATPEPTPDPKPADPKEPPVNVVIALTVLEKLLAVYNEYNKTGELPPIVQKAAAYIGDKAKAAQAKFADIAEANAWLSQRINLAAADEAQRARAQAGHDKAAAERKSRAASRAIRSAVVGLLLPLGLVLSGCSLLPPIDVNLPVPMTVTDGTDAHPEPQLAIEWPETIRRHEDIVTVQIDGRVISYGPLTEEQAAEFRSKLGQAPAED